MKKIIYVSLILSCFQSVTAFSRTYILTGTVKIVRDRQQIAADPIKKGAVIKGTLTIPDDFQPNLQPGQSSATTNTYRFKDGDQATLSFEVDGYIFKSNPNQTELLVQLSNDENKNVDALIIRSYDNVFERPGGGETIDFERNHISVQVVDSKGDLLSQNTSIPEAIDLTNIKQDFGITISGENRGKSFMVRGDIHNIRSGSAQPLSLSLTARWLKKIKSTWASFFEPKPATSVPAKAQK